MPFIEWENSFSTEIEQFDGHHKHLLNLLNKTYDDFICGAPNESILPILTELIKYSSYHFDAEESWMREHAYPRLAEHVHEHDSFCQKIISFYGEFENGKVSISLDVLTFLKNWLRQHILHSDADYARYHLSSTDRPE